MHEQGADFLNGQLLQAIGLGDLVPASLQRWRPLIVEGVLFLLRRLPPPRQAAMLDAQRQLPSGASPGQRLVALLAQCPTLHKLGQVVARHRGIPAHVRRELHVLESPPATTPVAELLARVRGELSPDAPVTIASEVLAEGSVAAVIPFTWQDGGEIRHGVFKVLKPGVEQRLHEELEVWLEVADFLQQRGRRLHVRCAADRSGGGCSRLADTRGSGSAGGGGAGAAAGAAVDLARVRLAGGAAR
jgi:ubiquinone biosynthesis protein